MHIASLEAHTTLITYNLWKFALIGHLNSDARTRYRTRKFLITRTPRLFSKRSNSHLLFKSAMCVAGILVLAEQSKRSFMILVPMSHVTIVTSVATYCPVLSEVFVSKLILVFEAEN